MTGIVGALREEGASTAVAAVSLLSTTAVFWIAHVWSEALAERVEAGHLLGWRRLGELAADDWPLVEAGTLPLVALALAWLGLYRDEVGFDAALAIGIAQLAAWGAAATRRARVPWRTAVLVGIVDAALGVAIVGLEIAVH